MKNVRKTVLERKVEELKGNIQEQRDLKIVRTYIAKQIKYEDIKLERERKGYKCDRMAQLAKMYGVNSKTLIDDINTIYYVDPDCCRSIDKELRKITELKRKEKELTEEIFINLPKWYNSEFDIDLLLSIRTFNRYMIYSALMNTHSKYSKKIETELGFKHLIKLSKITSKRDKIAKELNETEYELFDKTVVELLTLYTIENYYREPLFNKTELAKIIGISMSQFYYRVKFRGYAKTHAKKSDKKEYAKKLADISKKYFNLKRQLVDIEEEMYDIVYELARCGTKFENAYTYRELGQMVGLNVPKIRKELMTRYNYSIK